MDTSEFSILTWDSNFFGFPVAKFTPHSSADFSTGIELMKQSNIRLGYWFVDPDDQDANRFAQSHNFFLADRKVTYIRDTHLPTFKQDYHIISYLGHEATEQLIHLALESGVYSRFKKDTKMPPTVFSTLYEKWIKNSLNGEIAQDVLVYKENEDIQGLITLGEKKKRTDIGILAVDAKTRGKGIATTLMYHAIQKANERGYSYIQVVTQEDNIPACRFYEKMGFEIEGIENVYHIWFT